jgi:hypothetical protein
MRRQQLVFPPSLFFRSLSSHRLVEVGSYVTSCILADDVVGSLSFHSLHRLREEVATFTPPTAHLTSPPLSLVKVLDSIVRSRVSKMQIMQTTMFLV